MLAGLVTAALLWAAVTWPEKLWPMGELELQRLQVDAEPAVERNTPLEAQRADGRAMPAEAEADRVEEPQRQVREGAVREERTPRAKASPGRRGEDDAPNADLLEDGELELDVEENLSIAADA
jgi:hypothetical protein